MTKVLVLAGKKQSGKNTAANFVTGYTITQKARQGIPYLPTRFTIDDESGELIINTPKSLTLNSDEQYQGSGTLNLNSSDIEIQNWLHDCVHPYVKVYAFADMLKATANAIFGIPHEWVYGKDEDKRRATKIKWKNMCVLLPPKVVSNIKRAGKYENYMTVREFLQYFGTNVCRKLYDKCWVESCFNRIYMEQPEIAVIADARFANEVKASKAHDAKVIRLLREPCLSDIHESETDLKKVDDKNFDLTIPKDATIHEQNQLILDAMFDWEWFNRDKVITQDNQCL